MNSRLILPIAVAVLVLGMVMVIAGIVIPSLFYIGVYAVALGMIGIAAAFVVRLVSKPA